MADYGAIPVNKFEREDEATSLDVESPVCVVSSSKANRVIVDTTPIFWNGNVQNMIYLLIALTNAVLWLVTLLTIYSIVKHD